MNDFIIYRWRSLIITLLFIVIVPNYVLAGTYNNVKKFDSSSRSTSIIDTVMRVIDGDTFIIKGNRHVRLLCLDTPEKGEPFADKATAFAESLLGGKSIRLEKEKVAEDKYGRLLAYIFIDEKFFNELVLRSGLARIYFFDKNHRHAKELLAAQNDARKAKRGIWSLPSPALEPYYIVAGGSFRFHRPLCPDIKEINLKKAKRYKSRGDALDAGLSPCRDCKP